MSRTKKITTTTTHDFAHEIDAKTEVWAETVTTTWSIGGSDVATTGLMLDLRTGEYTKTFNMTTRRGYLIATAHVVSTETAHSMIEVWTNQFQK